MKALLPLVIYLFLLSCQSSPVDTFNSVKMGDNKGDVLYKIGNPNRTYQKGETHRWVYRFDGTLGNYVEREVWFQNGKVVYADQLRHSRKPSPEDFKPVE